MYNNEGTVAKVSSREWYDGQRGANVTLFSFQLAGTNRWFRTGTNNPNLREGEFVKFVNDAKGNVQLESIVKGAAPTPQAATPPQARAPQSSGRPARNDGGKDQYWKDREARDLEKEERYQTHDVPRMTFSAAQDRAVALVAAALAHDAIPLGQTKNKRLEILLEAVQEVTNRFFLDAINSPERLQALRDVDPYEGGAEEQQQEDAQYDE